MKTKGFYLALLLGSFTLWSCTNNENLSQSSLKTSLNNSVQQLTTAVTTISASPGYQVLAVSSTAPNSPSLVKSSVTAFDTTYNSILLADVAGVYNYKATPSKKWHNSLMRYFIKTDVNTHMVVSLPEEKVLHPYSLLRYSAKDSLLTNNYKIDVSDYQYSFNNRLGWNYKMASTINIKTVDVGALKIQSSYSKANDYKYASEFVFTDNYKAICNYTTGDTAVATYAINNGTKTLYEEKYTAIKTASMGNRHKEKEYSLTIGDVQIVRGLNHKNNSLDSAKVYVAGVLQLNSKVEFITDSTSGETESSVINKKRDLKITFDDGTSTTISELLGTSVTTIRSLFASLRQASFATSVIDWIAWDIYTNKE